MAVEDLKPVKKAQESATGWISDMRERVKQDLLKKVAEMIEVNVTNFHIRFEVPISSDACSLHPLSMVFLTGFHLFFAF